MSACLNKVLLVCAIASCRAASAALEYFVYIQSGSECTREPSSDIDRRASGLNGQLGVGDGHDVANHWESLFLSGNLNSVGLVCALANPPQTNSLSKPARIRGISKPPRLPRMRRRQGIIQSRSRVSSVVSQACALVCGHHDLCLS